MKEYLLLTTTIALFCGCITRAPTTYELDRRAGFNAPGDPSLPVDLSKLIAQSNIQKSALMPARTPPLVEKIWMADTSLADGAKLQGTWLFIEVEPGRWLDEMESGGSSPLALTPPTPTQAAIESTGKKTFSQKNFPHDVRIKQ